MILHGGDVIVHEEEPGQAGAGVRQPGGGHGLQVVVGQREDGEAADQSQCIIRLTDQSELSSPVQAGERGGAEADDGVVAEVQLRQGRQAWIENKIKYQSKGIECSLARPDRETDFYVQWADINIKAASIKIGLNDFSKTEYHEMLQRFAL